ncbi:SMC-Scp complex subunit ScpB [Candidatus Kaiserbacteria bacterium]|nr:SMC-Scp complex subunit ScpB [Candidatus Kaiserbacteria bacterium]
MMNMDNQPNNLSQKIEAVLFFKNEPVKRKWLETTLNKSADEVSEALLELKNALSSRGVTLVELNDSVALRTAPEHSDTLLELRKDELSRDLGKAGLETLSIILYRSPITRAEVDYIRGVNSTFIIRNLLVRGLVEKMSNPQDARSFLYQPTFSLLSFLGIPNVNELPEYEEVRKEIDQFEKEQKEYVE